MAKQIIWENKEQQASRLAYKSAETVIEDAPSLEMYEGITCVPQHFLKYKHTYESVSAIIQDIEFDKKYPIFVGEDAGQLYIQIGVIGKNNYKHPDDANPNHIVYGRKWRVEQNLPSGEIVQTIFLALKKAREHEIRELLQLKSERFGKTSAPFSGHHDLTVLAQLPAQPEYFQNDSDDIQSMLSNLQFDWCSFEVVDVTQLPRGKSYLNVRITTDATRNENTLVFPDLIGVEFGLVLERLAVNHFLQTLIRKLIEMSDKTVDEQFFYQGAAIFSQVMNVQKLADTSIQLRNKSALDSSNFHRSFKDTNFQVDASRVPKIKEIDKNQTLFSGLEGHLP